MDIISNTKDNKTKRCLYTDGDSEYLSLYKLKSYKRITPKFLSHIKVFQNLNSLKKYFFPPAENEISDNSILSHVSCK